MSPGPEPPLHRLLEPDPEPEQRLRRRHVRQVDEAPDLGAGRLPVRACLLDRTRGDVDRDVARKAEQVGPTAARPALVRPDDRMTRATGKAVTIDPGILKSSGL